MSYSSRSYKNRLYSLRRRRKKNPFRTRSRYRKLRLNRALGRNLRAKHSVQSYSRAITKKLRHVYQWSDFHLTDSVGLTNYYNYYNTRASWAFTDKPFQVAGNLLDYRKKYLHLYSLKLHGVLQLDAEGTVAGTFPSDDVFCRLLVVREKNKTTFDPTIHLTNKYIGGLSPNHYQDFSILKSKLIHFKSFTGGKRIPLHVYLRLRNPIIIGNVTDPNTYDVLSDVVIWCFCDAHMTDVGQGYNVRFDMMHHYWCMDDT